jgi:hypothetical protein
MVNEPLIYTHNHTVGYGHRLRTFMLISLSLSLSLSHIMVYDVTLYWVYKTTSCNWLFGISERFLL